MKLSQSRRVSYYPGGPLEAPCNRWAPNKSKSVWEAACSSLYWWSPRAQGAGTRNSSKRDNWDKWYILAILEHSRPCGPASLISVYLKAMIVGRKSAHYLPFVTDLSNWSRSLENDWTNSSKQKSKRDMIFNLLLSVSHMPDPAGKRRNKHFLKMSFLNRIFHSITSSLIKMGSCIFL